MNAAHGCSAIPLFGVNQPGANVSKGVLDSTWLWSMQSSWATVLPSFSNCSANAEKWQRFLQEMPLRTIFFPRPIRCSTEFALTFKIETLPCADRLIIRLIGELDATCLPELEAQIGSGRPSIELEMDEVTLVDIDVVRFLISCEARDIQLRGCPPYIREWIRREKEASDDRSSRGR
jgi:hypothetical protein